MLPENFVILFHLLIFIYAFSFAIVWIALKDIHFAWLLFTQKYSHTHSYTITDCNDDFNLSTLTHFSITISICLIKYLTNVIFYLMSVFFHETGIMCGIFMEISIFVKINISVSSDKVKVGIVIVGLSVSLSVG